MTVKVHVENFQSIRKTDMEISGLTVVTGPNNSGKALAHGTPVATPSGWVPIEDVVPGQEVLAGDGSSTRVLGVFPQGVRLLCRVLFDDGRSVVVDYDHLWPTSILSERFPASGQNWVVRSTRDLIEMVGTQPVGDRRPAIPRMGGAQHNTQAFPLDPYLLGALLGGGSFRGSTPRISSQDPEVLQEVEGLLPTGVTLSHCGGSDYRLVRGKGHHNPVTEALRDLNLWGGLSQDKSIPEKYLLGDLDQRKALLQGLMDTDGGVSQGGSSEFYSTSLALAKGVQRLVWSFGGSARLRVKTLNKYKHEGQVRTGLPSYTVTFRIPDFVPFRLARKACLLSLLKRRDQPLMVGFEPAGESLCTCIQVEHPSHLFVVGDYLVTHNTALQRAVRGVFENTPGTAFVRHGTKASIVELVFDDGHTVKWEKGITTKPTYTVDGGKPLYPGRQVPDEVRGLGVRPIVAGGQDVWPNIAPQFSGQVFLIDKPGPVLAEAVADVERVGHLNRALRRTASDQRAAASELRVRQGDLAKHEEELAFFNGLDDAEALVALAEKAEKMVQKIGRAVEGLTSLRDRLADATATVEAYKGVEDFQLPEAESLDMIVADIAGLSDLRGRVSKVRDRVLMFEGVGGIELPYSEGVSKTLAELKSLEELRERLLASRLVADRYSGVELVLGGVGADPPESTLADLDELISLRDRWQLAVSGGETSEQVLREAQASVEEARRGINDALAELGECPLCHRALEGT